MTKCILYTGFFVAKITEIYRTIFSKLSQKYTKISHICDLISSPHYPHSLLPNFPMLKTNICNFRFQKFFNVKFDFQTKRDFFFIWNRARLGPVGPNPVSSRGPRDPMFLAWLSSLLQCLNSTPLFDHMHKTIFWRPSRKTGNRVWEK